MRPGCAPRHEPASTALERNGHCPAVQGDWHVRRHLTEAAYEPPLPEGTGNLDTVTIAGDQPHWCWDRGRGTCPPGES